MRAGGSLDERYLEFTAQSGAAFAQFPQLEALRHFVFKDLVVQRGTEGWRDRVAHWLRPLRMRQHTQRLRRHADVLIWVESRRDVIADALVPVYRELTLRDIDAQLISLGGPPSLPGSAADFHYSARARPPAWAGAAWDALAECIDELRDRALRRPFLSACAVAESVCDEIHRVLATVAPTTVLAAATQLIGGAALVVGARAHGAESLLLQHGILQPVYTPLLADRMLTWGQTSTEILVALGIPRSRLVTVGSPRHDTMHPVSNGEARAQLLRAAALPDRPTFVFFSNGNDLLRNGDAPLQCAVWLERAAARYRHAVNIVVRLHPNEDGALYRHRPHLRVLRAELPLATTLEGCDWLGSLCSTALYDGLLYGKPVWQCYAEGWPALADNWRQGLAVRVSSERHLCDLIGATLGGASPGALGRPLVGRVFANHGRATQAVADVVASTLAASPANPPSSIASRAS
jgi:hypothetical protein